MNDTIDDMFPIKYENMYAKVLTGEYTAPDSVKRIAIKWAKTELDISQKIVDELKTTEPDSEYIMIFQNIINFFNKINDLI